MLVSELSEHDESLDHAETFDFYAVHIVSCYEFKDNQMRVRFYNPCTLIGTQEDPHWTIRNMQSSVAAIMQASNLYVYTINNPIMWIDPTGLFVQWHDNNWTSGTCTISGLNFTVESCGGRTYSASSGSRGSSSVTSAYFIFHCSDFVSQAQWKFRQILNSNASANIFVKHVTTVELFISGWNGMRYLADQINSIFIFTHGHERAIMFDYDGTGTNALSIDGYSLPRNGVRIPLRGSMSDLNSITISGNVHLFSCNPGHLNPYFNGGYNFASALSTRVTGGAVTGFDGNVGFGTGTVRGFNLNYITGNWSPRLSVNQYSFAFGIHRNSGALSGSAAIRHPQGQMVFYQGSLVSAFMPIPR